MSPTPFNLEQKPEDFTPFFMLLQSGDFKRAEKELRNYPNNCNLTIKSPGFYEKNLSTEVNGLQLACAHSPPVEFVELFQELNPKAFRDVDSSFQRNALHIAVMNEASCKVINALLKVDQKSAAAQDIHGRLPIHYAFKHAEHCEQSIRRLLRAYPASVKVADDAGFLPLHVACRMGVPMCIIRLLIRTAPETILAKTNKGSTPVHCAKQFKGRDPEAQARIVDTLKKVATETLNMIQSRGPMSVRSGSSISRHSSEGQSHYSRYTIGDNWDMNKVPDSIAISADETEESESDTTCT